MTIDGHANVVGIDDPIRLKDAIAIAFPHGGITVSGLRAEARRGRLKIERIAGKDFTTLRDVHEMRAACRVSPKDMQSCPVHDDNHHLIVANAIVERLKLRK